MSKVHSKVMSVFACTCWWGTLSDFSLLRRDGAEQTEKSDAALATNPTFIYGRERGGKESLSTVKGGMEKKRAWRRKMLKSERKWTDRERSLKDKITRTQPP